MYHRLHPWRQIEDVNLYYQIPTHEYSLNGPVRRHHQIQHDRLEDRVYGVEFNHCEIEYIVQQDE